MRKCPRCEIEKEDGEFYSFTGRAVGSTRWCKECWRAYQREYRKQQDPEALSRAQRRYRAKYKYGLSLEEYDALIAQGCSVCRRTDGKMVMDHCHTTDAVRAPLCSQCNVALGMAEDSPKRLRDLADYLERHAAT